MFPSSWFGFRRHFRGCLAFFGFRSFAAASAFSLLPPSEGRLDRRLAVFIAFPFVDKICLYVDFICIYADIFVTLQYSYKVSIMFDQDLYQEDVLEAMDDLVEGLSGSLFRVSGDSVSDRQVP